MDNPETLDKQETGRRQTKQNITQTTRKMSNTDSTKKTGVNRGVHEGQAVLSVLRFQPY